MKTLKNSPHKKHSLFIYFFAHIQFYFIYLFFNLNLFILIGD